jgi:hypothetical protein
MREVTALPPEQLRSVSTFVRALLAAGRRRSFSPIAVEQMDFSPVLQDRDVEHPAPRRDPLGHP